jgi:hypothetical protein
MTTQRIQLDTSPPRIIPDPHREAVCEAVAIEKVARRHIPGLEPFGGGGWYTADCPFEDNKDQSFYIVPAGTWQCEGCDRGGDVVDLEFLCGNYISPSEAMLALAIAYDVVLPQNRKGNAPGLSGAHVVPDGAELLRKLAAYVRRYVVLTDEQADLLALWVVHTYALDAADTTPYIEVASAEKRSGKTRLLEVLSTVVARSWFTGRVTSAVLVRKVADLTPTLLLDESDAAFKGDREYAETLRGVLNAGFRRGGVASLCVGQGANLTYEDFAVFSPKMIAGIGKLPDTGSDRAIKVELRRKTRSEPVVRFRLREVEPEAGRLRMEAAAWAEAYLERLVGLEPPLPEELDDRAQEISEPLLAIAEEAGGDWPERACRAVIALAGASTREDSESLGIRLLRDIRGVFEEKKADRLPTGELLESLHAEEEAPWGSLRGESLDARGLSRLLKPYGIRPEKLREGERTFRGYKQASFEDAWSRYAPATPGEAEHVEHPELPANRADSGVPHVPEHAWDAEHETPHKQRDVPHVPGVPPNPEGGKRGGLAAGKCIHNYFGGKGCYLCDPTHPYRIKEGAR